MAVPTTINVVLEEGAVLPARQYTTDAGLALYAPAAATIPAGGYYDFDTGVHAEFPTKHYGRVEGCYDLNQSFNLVAAGYIIDEGYSGTVKVRLYNCGESSVTVEAGAQIALLLCCPCAYVAPTAAETITAGDRGTSTANSTGTGDVTVYTAPSSGGTGEEGIDGVDVLDDDTSGTEGGSGTDLTPGTSDSTEGIDGVDVLNDDTQSGGTEGGTGTLDDNTGDATEDIDGTDVLNDTFAITVSLATPVDADGVTNNEAVTDVTYANDVITITADVSALTSYIPTDSGLETGKYIALEIATGVVPVTGVSVNETALTAEDVTAATAAGCEAGSFLLYADSEAENVTFTLAAEGYAQLGVGIAVVDTSAGGESA